MTHVNLEHEKWNLEHLLWDAEDPILQDLIEKVIERMSELIKEGADDEEV